MRIKPIQHAYSGLKLVLGVMSYKNNECRLMLTDLFDTIDPNSNIHFLMA